MTYLSSHQSTRSVRSCPRDGTRSHAGRQPLGLRTPFQVPGTTVFWDPTWAILQSQARRTRFHFGGDPESAANLRPRNGQRTDSGVSEEGSIRLIIAAWEHSFYLYLAMPYSHDLHRIGEPFR